MNVRLYVVAGNLYQFQEFRKRKLATSYWHQTMFPDARDWVFVSTPNSLRGCTIEHGTFIGSWRQLPNLEGIFRQLMICCKMDSATAENLVKIHDNWQDEVAKELLNFNVSIPKQPPLVLPQPVTLKQDPDMDFLLTYARLVEESA